LHAQYFYTVSIEKLEFPFYGGKPP